MSTRRDFLKEVGMAAAGLALGSSNRLFAQPMTSKE